METIEIQVSEYYNHPEFYRFMPPAIFDLLNSAYTSGELTAVVSKAEFETMINNFKISKDENKGKKGNSQTGN